VLSAKEREPISRFPREQNIEVMEIVAKVLKSDAFFPMPCKIERLGETL
jgi:hypothetical protein